MAHSQPHESVGLPARATVLLDRPARLVLIGLPGRVAGSDLLGCDAGTSDRRSR